MQRTSLRFAAAAALGLFVAAEAGPAFADAAEDAIQGRRGYYRIVALNFGPLVGMAKGDVAYDSETAQMHADNLAALATLNLAPLYPAGTDNDARFGDTRALPKIWTDQAGVAEKGQGFAAAVEKLAGAAGGGLDALRPAVGALGESCKACHDVYRAKEF